MITINSSKESTNNLAKNGKIEKDKVKLKSKKRKAFWPISVLSLYCTVDFLKNTNDFWGHRLVTQDVVTNIGMSEMFVRNPKRNFNQYMEFFKETAFMVFPLLMVLPKTVDKTQRFFNNGEIIPKNKHHFFEWSVLTGAVMPLLVAETAGYFLNKVEPKEKLSKKQLKEQETEVKKIATSATIASLLRITLLSQNILKKPTTGQHKLVGNAVALSNMLNALKAMGYIYYTHKNGERIRPSKSMSAIFFDGVIAQSVAYGIDKFIHQPFKLPNTKSFVAFESIIGGLIALKGINLVSHNLEPILNWALGNPSYG